MNYLELLNNSYEKRDWYMSCPPDNKLAWLGDQVFNITTYDDGMDAFFASKALAVCHAITTGTTYDYIKQSEENHRWYLMMCNLPFFANAIDWGGSIRGAWWASPHEGKITYRALWAFEVDDQIADDLEFDTDEWFKFIEAILEFAKDEF